MPHKALPDFEGLEADPKASQKKLQRPWDLGRGQKKLASTASLMLHMCTIFVGLFMMDMKKKTFTSINKKLEMLHFQFPTWKMLEIWLES